LAEELKDRATYNFLQWFIDEQVEEEANDREIIDKLKLIGDSKNGLFMLEPRIGRKTTCFRRPGIKTEIKWKKQLNAKKHSLQ